MRSSFHSSVFSSQFSGPARPHLCSEPCPPARLSSSCSHPPSPPGIQAALDRHVLFPPLTLSDLLSQPDQQICFSQPPLPCQSASFSFLHSLPNFLVDVASPGPPSLHCFPPSFSAPLLDLLLFPKLLLLVTSHPLHFNQLSPTYRHHSQVDRE